MGPRWCIIISMCRFAGCRAMCFQDRYHCANPESARHPTDIFVSFPETSSGDCIVQTANRISGTYVGNPALRVWTSESEQPRTPGVDCLAGERGAWCAGAWFALCSETPYPKIKQYK